MLLNVLYLLQIVRLIFFKLYFLHLSYTIFVIVFNFLCAMDQTYLNYFHTPYVTHLFMIKNLINEIPLSLASSLF